MNQRIGNPAVFGLSTFGLALALLGFQMVVGPATAGATLYGVLVAALGESLAGLWSIARGDGYLGGVLTTFGLWLFGYYMFLTAGIAAHLFTPAANGLYILMLVIPVAFMTVPAVTQRRTVLSLAFASLLAMLLALGFGSYYSVSSLNTIGGILAYVSAVLVWYLAYESVLEAAQSAHHPDPNPAH